LRIMNPTDSDNPELDALFLRAAKHAELRVELCRALPEAELFTLIPQGPVDGAEAGELIEMENPGDIPFMLWAKDGKQHFFVYTLEEKAKKALQAFSGPPREPMIVISMEGRQMLELMRRPGVGIALNAGAAKCDFTFNDAVLAGMLDGTMFAPLPPVEQVHGRMKALRPEQYPLSVVQPVFDYLKTRPEAHAAWVLEMMASRERGEDYYIFALLSSMENPKELHDAVFTVLSMVNMDERKGMKFGVTSFDIGNPAMVKLMRAYVPFYATPDYKAPAVQSGE